MSALFFSPPNVHVQINGCKVPLSVYKEIDQEFRHEEYYLAQEAYTTSMDSEEGIVACHKGTLEDGVIVYQSLTNFLWRTDEEFPGISCGFLKNTPQGLTVVQDIHILRPCIENGKEGMRMVHMHMPVCGEIQIETVGRITTPSDFMSRFV